MRLFGTGTRFGLIAVTLLAQAAAQDTGKLPPAAAGKVDFARDILPILQQRCQACHGAGLQSGGLRLDSQAAALKGGYSGPAFIAGDSAGSRLVQLVAGLVKDRVMPMAGPRLTAEQVGLLRAWIDRGADWPASFSGETATQAPSRSSKSSHWAFIPPARPAVPATRHSGWVHNPIDAFVLSKLEAQSIEPAPEADRATLIRRLSLDLTGLPPTPGELSGALADKGPEAYERLVDRLLASPHYGEKWARYWLDQARYGDSDGFETDAPRPWAWRWRNWVIDALNRNMPFDQFSIEQLAGDLLPDASIEQKVATGFNRNTLTNREGGMDLEMLRIEQIMDRTSTLGTVWLGLTVGCAQCHDHKYDPISQKAYYQLFAFFNNADEVNLEAPLDGEMGPYLHNKPERDRRRRELLAEYKVADVQKEWERKTLEAATNPKVGDQWILAWETVGYDFDGGQDILRLDPARRSAAQQDALTDHMIKWYGLVAGSERYKALRFDQLKEKLERLEEEFPPLSQAPAMEQSRSPRTTHLLIRGDYRQPGIEVQPGTPAVLPPLPEDVPQDRLALARWLFLPDQPLTARVAVNRMWQEFFGRGLVESSENFGVRGDRPSNQELLDWLAVEFQSSGWDVKHMHKLIVESATYRQSSKVRPELESRDPDNRLLARQSRLRLTAELIRDSALSASGLLNPAIGGKSVFPPQPSSVGELAYRNQWKESKGRDRYRRGLYVFRKRTMTYPEMSVFDAPDGLTACTRRERSTTPLQALNLLNDPVFMEAARGLATRVLRESSPALSSRIDYAFRLCLARRPNAQESARIEKYYEQQKRILSQDKDSAETLYPAEGVEGIDRAEAAAWVGVASVLLNLDEFITRI